MNSKHTYQWAIIGAGPSGIAAVGKLLDQGISGDEILWLDPQFSVGDLGSKWFAVSSNTKVKFFTSFLEDCPSFQNQDRPKDFAFDQLDQEETCELGLVVEPLQWITDQLKSRTQTSVDTITGLELKQRQWHITGKQQNYTAQNAILAIGSDPKHLEFNNVEEIILEDALVPDRLKIRCSTNDTVAVFGSSHSAVLILQQLVEMGIKKVVNFYMEPMRYAVAIDDWILHDNTGLKGKAAEWAKEHINGQLPDNLIRLQSTPENIQAHLKDCNKAIYAVGFNKRHIEIKGMDQIRHNPHNSIIAPGLFGIGICFPEEVTDCMGNCETNVGLWKFMQYINKIMPIWLNYAP